MTRRTAVAGPVRSSAEGWVLDASVTLPWFFPDEATPFTEGLLDALPVRVDHEPLGFATIDCLATAHALSAYDAAYLELALRRSLTLVSLDARRLDAAAKLGHPVLTGGPGSTAHQGRLADD